MPGRTVPAALSLLLAGFVARMPMVPALVPMAAAAAGRDAAPPALEARSLQSGGLERHYLLHRAPGARGPSGLVFVLHGSNGDAKGIRAMLGERLERLTDRAGFSVVYPEGIERHWNDCRASATYAANRRNVDDPAFLRAVVAALRDEGRVDPRRVFAIGLSNGGQMVLRLALEDAGTYAGFAAISANLPVPANNDCRIEAAPGAMLFFSGTADPINPFHGGLVRIGNDISRGHVLSAEYTASWFAKRAGQAGASTARALPDRDPGDGSRAELIRWDEPGRPPVALYVLHGGGHTIPGTRPRPGSGPAATNLDIDAAAEAWRFFRSVDPAVAGAAP